MIDVPAPNLQATWTARCLTAKALSRGEHAPRVVCQEILLSRQPEHAEHFSVRKNSPSRDLACAMALASMSLA